MVHSLAFGVHFLDPNLFTSSISYSSGKPVNFIVSLAGCLKYSLGITPGSPNGGIHPSTASANA